MPLVTSSAAVERKIVDACLGFAAGASIAASYWSLLRPAVELSEHDAYAWVLPAVAGAVFGAVCEWLLQRLGVSDGDLLPVHEALHISAVDVDDAVKPPLGIDETVRFLANDALRLRRPHGGSVAAHASRAPTVISEASRRRKIEDHKRLLLLVLAVTVRNLPNGVAVGVGFASVGKTAGATFEHARNLAIGIGLQSFPASIAVGMPLHRHGEPLWKCVFYGQLSRIVELIGGVLGAWAAVHVEPLLPYALAFAAGRMIFPEIVARTKRSFGSWGVVVGFLAMVYMV
jgi:solute carrier family 39 (zinc transporter), member 11